MSQFSIQMRYKERLDKLGVYSLWLENVKKQWDSECRLNPVHPYHEKYVTFCMDDDDWYKFIDYSFIWLESIEDSMGYNDFWLNVALDKFNKIQLNQPNQSNQSKVSNLLNINFNPIAIQALKDENLYDDWLTNLENNWNFQENRSGAGNSATIKKLEECRTGSDLIYFGFGWEDSPQGFYYWQSKKRELENKSI